MFGLLCSSQKLLYVLSDLLRLADDVLCARQGGVFLSLLPWLHCFRGWKRAAVNEEKNTYTPRFMYFKNKEVVIFVVLDFGV